MTEHKVRVYKDRAGEWRWTITNLANGNITHASTEGYKNREECVANLFAYPRLSPSARRALDLAEEITIKHHGSNVEEIITKESSQKD